MRRLLRASLAFAITLALVLPTVAPALCQWADAPCDAMCATPMDAGVAWSAPGHAMSGSCAAPDCGLVHAAPIVLADRLSNPLGGSPVAVAVPASRAAPAPRPLTPPPIA